MPTQLQVATVKSFCQGSDDLRGANWVILLEEFTFLPAYVTLLIVGIQIFFSSFLLSILGLRRPR